HVADSVVVLTCERRRTLLTRHALDERPQLVVVNASLSCQSKQASALRVGDLALSIVDSRLTCAARRAVPVSSGWLSMGLVIRIVHGIQGVALSDLQRHKVQIPALVSLNGADVLDRLDTSQLGLFHGRGKDNLLIGFLTVDDGQRGNLRGEANLA